jgi:glyoxylase-like metal-dependent hydrolase (beta-lactamase superfamily II)
MAQQIPVTEEAIAGASGDAVKALTPDLAFKRLALVNVVLVGRQGAGDRGWVLVDAGVPGSKGAIRRAAAERFGDGARPAAIVLTHGHFDHVGVLESLAEEWDVPVWAHRLERPYLDGSASYPPPDAGVGGGIMPLLSPLFPTAPVDVSPRLHDLPEDGSVPPLPGWRWIHTPGHSVGHVSFLRGRDMIVGDAFVTTAQESAYAIAVQEPELHGPPMYFTPDWEAARTSVEKLAGLDPELVITGHGQPMQGAAMREALKRLAATFDTVAVPDHGRYVGHPARAEDGTAYRET